MEEDKNLVPEATPATPVQDAGNPVGDVKEQGAGTDAQMPVTPSQLDNLRGMVSSRHDNAEYANDDDFYAQIADDYASHDKELSDYKDREERMGNLFGKDPRSAQFLNDWIEGGDPVVAMVKRYGLDDFKDALDDPEKLEAIANANKAFVEQTTKEKELEAEYKKNLETSLEEIDNYQKEKGLSDEQVDEVMQYLIGVAHDIVMGKFSPALFDAACKSKNYDKDIASASHEGEVRGKNTKFDEELRKPSKGDGMPQLGSRSGGNAPQRPQVAGALGREKKSVWDQGGGIKRTPSRNR